METFSESLVSMSTFQWSHLFHCSYSTDDIATFLDFIIICFWFHSAWRFWTNHLLDLMNEQLLLSFFHWKEHLLDQKICNHFNRWGGLFPHLDKAHISFARDLFFSVVPGAGMREISSLFWEQPFQWTEKMRRIPAWMKLRTLYILALPAYCSVKWNNLE